MSDSLEHVREEDELKYATKVHRLGVNDSSGVVQGQGQLGPYLRAAGPLLEHRSPPINFTCSSKALLY